MKKRIKIFCTWELEIDFESEKQVELYVDQVPPSPHDGSVIRIVFLLEPPTFINLTAPILNNQHLFDYVLTHNEDILGASEKAILFEGLWSWVKELDVKQTKKYEVSTVAGFKMISEGHTIRRELWANQQRIQCPKKFFLSHQHKGLENIDNNPILGSKMEDKISMFDSQFHIAIESTKRTNFFTEKLLDALITKTVPIYYGCPNIGDWFNVKGMICVNTTEDIVSACNSLSEDTYASMLDNVEENFQIAKQYVNIGERLREKIEYLIKT